MKNKKKTIIFIIASIVMILGIICFFIKNNYKTVKFGNNTIKSTENIEEYILNINSYEAEISLEVCSNKNKNKYKIRQKFSNPNIFKQEIIEPTNIEGLTTIYDGKNLKIENTQVGLSKIYDDYQYISSNFLCLNDFITEYKNNNDTRIEEKEDMVIMELKSKNSTNKYNYYKKLYISKSTLKPIRMEVKDINKKMLVYILYDEIKINSVNKEEVLAFKLKEQLNNI